MTTLRTLLGLKDDARKWRFEPTGGVTGTSVQTAIQQVDSGKVTINGPLGTPSSGTLTNCTGLPISTGVSGLGVNVSSALQNTLNASSGLTSFNGVLGTVQAGSILTNATGLPISTGVTGLGTGVATALALNIGVSGSFVVNTITSNSASAFAVGPNGTTNPTFQVACNVGSAATGLLITGEPAGTGLSLATISSGGAENLIIDAKSTGTITLGQNSTGNIVLNRTINNPVLTASNLVSTDGSKNLVSTTTVQLAAALSAPQISVFTSGSAQTYTTPSGAKYLVVEVAGGGGGGAGSGTTPGAAGAGVASSFAGGAVTLTANGGSAGNNTGSTIAAGGTASGGDVNLPGQVGGSTENTANRAGGAGGHSMLFPGGGTVNSGLPSTPVVGNAAIVNTGGGGGGGSSGGTAVGASGGGGGGYTRKLITSPNATFTYTVGGGGSGGTLGTGGAAGGAGAAGIIIVTAYFQ